MGDGSYCWPPLIHWPKWRFPKHPREAREPGSILLWRNAKALNAVGSLAPLVTPLANRAFEIYSAHSFAANHNEQYPVRATPGGIA